MSFNAYIVIDLDHGQRAVSTTDPVTKTFDGTEFAFISGASDVSLPSSKINPESGRGSSGEASVRLFDDELTPGALLSTYARIQGCRMRVWVEGDDATSLLAFDGEVNGVKHLVDEASIIIVGGPVQRNVEIPFPPGFTLEDGRFIDRETKHIEFRRIVNAVYEDATATFIWLKDKMQFKSQFGTPDAPSFPFSGPQGGGGVPAAYETEYILENIIQIDGSHEYGDITEAGTYLHWENSAKNDAIPVIYGRCINVPLRPMAHYRLKFPGRDISGSGFHTNYAKVYIYIVACHPVIGDDRETGVLLMANRQPGGGTPDFYLSARWGDDHFVPAPLSAAVSSYEGGIPGYTVGDGLGGTVSYVTIPVPYTDDTFDNILGSAGQIEQLHLWDDSGAGSIFTVNCSGYGDFVPGEARALMCKGKPKSGTEVMSGLGDVIYDMWTTFGAGTADAVDWETSARSTSKLNSYTCDMIVNTRQKAQTIDRVVNSRMAKQFPVAFGYPRGKLAWTSTALPTQTGGGIRHFVYGEDLLERTAITETPRSKIENVITYSYGLDGERNGNRFTGRIDETNSNVCRASASRWGKSRETRIDLPDTQDAVTASLVAAERLNQRAGVRIAVSYTCTDVSTTRIPLLSVVSITDEPAAFDEEEFFFLGYEWGQDLTSITLDFISVSMV